MAGEWHIKHPEWLEIPYDDKISYGYNQEWYHTEWQRLAGCGPTTATQLINYVSFRDGLLEPDEYKSKLKVIESMELVWPYVQPRRGGGLFKTRWQSEGLETYIRERQLPYKVELLRIMPFPIMRPSLEELENFIIKIIAEDSPIAFLNRHNGGEVGLQTWHWVPLIGMKRLEDDVIGIVYDDEVTKEFSMKKWLNATIFGGGFVGLLKQ